MSLQVVRVLVRVIIPIREVDARIRTVIIEPAFHFTIFSHNYLQFFVDFVCFSPQSLVVLFVPPQLLVDLVFLTSLIISPLSKSVKLLSTKIL